MQVFAAFSLGDANSLEQRVELRYPGAWHKTEQGAFFIATSGETTREVATKVGLGDQEPFGTGIVVPVTSYWGRHSHELWEWISVKLNANGG